MSIKVRPLNQPSKYNMIRYTYMQPCLRRQKIMPFFLIK